VEGHHHDLAKEFPEHQDKIHYLKLSDAHFRKLCERYEAIDKQIARFESRIELGAERDEEILRKERLIIKDQIYKTLLR
jgi:uncharacterized protein YdcH (DUF465 family)